VLDRIERKLGEVQRWVDSVHNVADWPAAVTLAMYRTRPAATDRRIWVRPAALNGFAVRVNAAKMSDFVIYEEVFIDGLYDLDRVSFTPDTIVDCGAYHGYFSLLAAARFPRARVIAFEPNADNLRTLQANIARNGIAIAVRAEAVSTRDGSAEFSGDGCGGGLGAASADSIAVPVADLGRVIRELDCERLLLKLDVEGEEAAILPAVMTQLPRHCAIFFEWHHGREAYSRIAALLSANGFNVVVSRENCLENGIIFIDAFAER
jgi:FkbM family methyltransferase